VPTLAGVRARTLTVAASAAVLVGCALFEPDYGEADPNCYFQDDAPLAWAGTGNPVGVGLLDEFGPETAADPTWIGHLYVAAEPAPGYDRPRWCWVVPLTGDGEVAPLDQDAPGRHVKVEPVPNGWDPP
jgi:hypothetical protein